VNMPAKIPALKTRGAMISKGKAIAKRPQPLPRKVNAAQVQFGRIWLASLSAKNELTCWRVKNKPNPNAIGSSGKSQNSSRGGRLFGGIQLHCDLQHDFCNSNCLHTDIILAGCFAMIRCANARRAGKLRGDRN